MFVLWKSTGELGLHVSLELVWIMVVWIGFEPQFLLKPKEVLQMSNPPIHDPRFDLVTSLDDRQRRERLLNDSSPGDSGTRWSVGVWGRSNLGGLQGTPRGVARDISGELLVMGGPPYLTHTQGHGGYG